MIKNSLTKESPCFGGLSFFLLMCIISQYFSVIRPDFDG
ncbi:conserved hypothetical protein [delta proteobacterium NaphS2]|nr:conserved hypothetical protein [delta proteobacterium NaphS2]